MAESGAELASGAQLAAHSQGIPEVRWASGSASMQSIAIAKSGIIKVCSKCSYLYVELIANLDMPFFSFLLEIKWFVWQALLLTPVPLYRRNLVLDFVQ